MTKVPSAEEMLALVDATTGSNGMMDPTMQSLWIQLQEQHALIQAHGHGSRPRTDAKAAVSESTGLEKMIDCSEVAQLEHVSIPQSEPPSLNSTVMKRKSIPLSMKKEAIEWIMGPGKGIPSRAEKHFGWDVSASSFRKWWKNRDSILKDLGSKKRIRGGGRKPYLEDSEEKLLVVLIQERAKKDRVTRKWIAKTAQHMFQRSSTNFKASENWVTKFIRRNKLTLKRSCVACEPQQECLEVQQSETLPGSSSAVTPEATTTTLVL
uniref:HTH CENPB-type domain-containing protein n=1 Tax=Peronospora matthiolae TaxID=2874970 RepID=A0AAV1V222_9STRA